MHNYTQDDLAEVQRLLAKARKAKRPAEEIEKLEASLRYVSAKLRGEDPDPVDTPDSPLGVALYKKLAPQDPDEDGDARIDTSVGLSLLVVSVPRQATQEEQEEAEAKAELACFYKWVDEVDASLRLAQGATDHRGRARIEYLKLLAKDAGITYRNQRWRLAAGALLCALRMLNEPQRTRIGVGHGSRKFDLIPSEESIHVQLIWLAQQAKALVVEWLDSETQPSSDQRRQETEWEADYRDRPDALAAIEAEEDHQRKVRKRVQEIFDLARGREGEKLERFQHYLGEGLSVPEAKKRTAEDFGNKVNTIDRMFTDLRQRLPLRPIEGR
jgi:hypothetical protein